MMSHDVIVCVHNGGAVVEVCLESLSKHWNPQELQKLIIVDDCSGEAMKQFLEDWSAQREYIELIRHDEQHYYTRAANSGLLASDAKYRTLINSDTLVTNGWEIKIRKAFEQNNYVGIVGPLSNAASTQSVPFVKSSQSQTAINSLPPGVSVDQMGAFVEKAAQGTLRPFTPLVHGFCLSVKSDVFDQIGYFDEELFPFGYGEENDFCFRADDEGFLLSIAVDTFIYHVKSVSCPSEERQAYMQESMKRLAARHGSKRIRAAIEHMEQNPSLEKLRNAVLDEWPDFYEVAG